ncbi:translation elongation factor Ts [Acholeplasma laidlawii]|uniref:translation elongation factor Ts n=1 Tax=Acholeplasma laidlawii TaxID=2148 RepID=UPI00084C012F|nr:translation elongation factor Ts [Acholeplasma laidlawii]OED59055.1 translation elongation factor Ts [Acholeplasma laidlawii]
MTITAAMVKELRQKTGAGMLDCKKALEETNGDIEAAATLLREKGIAKAAKKADRIAAEGLTSVVVKGNEAVLFELNSETDFVAKNKQFTDLIEGLGNLFIESNVASAEEALALKDASGKTVEEVVLGATATIGEKISLRRVIRVKKSDTQGFGAYKHMGGRISVLTVLETPNEELAKELAMHITVFNPQFLSRNDVNQSTIDVETKVISEQIANDESLQGKPEKILNGILQGRLNKVLQEIVLLDQGFVKDPSVTVANYLKSANNNILSYVRLEVGEGIEKRVDDFAAEVMAQVNK